MKCLLSIPESCARTFTPKTCFFFFLVDAVETESFRPGGSTLKKKDDSVANSNAQAFGGPGAYGNPFPSFPGPPGLGVVRRRERGQANKQRRRR